MGKRFKGMYIFLILVSLVSVFAHCRATAAGTKPAPTRARTETGSEY